ncbi:SDR family oxidoreductase [Streptomyces xiamenensis]|uniref:SDR family oxidoreductase n=1 Tax=Streptomyces xiamenensis TaxID=408015 RepID=UPI0037D27019
MEPQVLVVIGVGGMGQAIARRQSAGRTVLLADFNEELLGTVADTLRGDGHTVLTRPVDVSSRSSVAALADAAAGAGSVTQVVHTAGLSPVMAPPAAILGVDLLGTALVLEEFGRVVAPGGAGVVIASLAGHFAAGTLDAAQESALAHTPSDALPALPVATAVATSDEGYGLSKRANQLRVQAASVTWGRRGARINSISPGVIATPMGHQELKGDSGPRMRAMVEASAAKRMGTPEDIADAAAFLLGPAASFITGTDLLVDGGAFGAVHTAPAE